MNEYEQDRMRLQSALKKTFGSDIAELRWFARTMPEVIDGDVVGLVEMLIRSLELDATMAENARKDLYYTAPPDANFEELRDAAAEIWRSIDPEKETYVLGIRNVRDNFMYLVGMLDSNNQLILSDRLYNVTRRMVHDRIVSTGGTDETFKIRE